MEDKNETIEHLHAAIQLIGVAAFAIGRAESQIATTDVRSRLEDELSEIRSLAQLCKEVSRTLSDALDDKRGPCYPRSCGN